jgi:sodium-dependent dicarboxylate transporter 2/3/5
MEKKRLITLLSGPLLFLLILLWNPAELEATQNSVLACLAWMLVWWISEVVPMAVTSLLPIVLFPLLNVLSIEKTCLSYSNRFIFLFLGGFVIALAMEKWNLHRRMALNIVKMTGTSANRIILGFFLASYLISMWISNTATALMMLPIAGSVVALLVTKESIANNKGTRNFAMTMMFAIAYGANIGGVGTLVGSPPNTAMAGILSKSFDYHVTFLEWMKIGLPFSFALLILSYFILVKVVFPNRLGSFKLGHETIINEIKSLGALSKAEARVLIVFLLTALLWIIQDPVSKWLKAYQIEYTDTTIAMIAVIALFLLPSGKDKTERVLQWKDSEKLPWGVLLMFGGGMALAEAFTGSGLAQTISAHMAGLDSSNLFWYVTTLTATGIVMTSMMSNIAMVNFFIPVVGALALQANVSPVLFAIPVTIASSCDFMFPMGTPPNAIAYSSGYIKSFDMLRGGIALNILALLLLMGVIALQTL